MSLSHNQHRFILGIFLLLCLVATANYYFGLRLFGRLDTGAYVFSVAVLVLYSFALASMKKGTKGRGSTTREP